MILFHSVLFAMGVMVGLGGPTDARGTIVRQELQIVNKKLPGAETDPRRDVHVFVEVSPVQPRVAGGICFVIDVGNEGSEPVELADITADGRIGLSVWNAHGVPVDLPDDEGTTTSNPGGWARRHGLPEHIKAEIKERRPFAVMKPYLLPDDPKVKSIESIKDGKIRLEPGEHFQVQVLITKVLGEPEKWQAEMEKRSANPHTPFPGLGAPEIARIDTGTYQLLVHVPLMVEGKHPWGASSSERLTVRLGAPADEEKEP
jgi:hypothetical protein